MQLVDLALAVRVLRAPHPLFAGDEDLQRVLRGGGIHLGIELRAPREDEHRDHERDHRPCDFEFQMTFDLLGDFALAAAAIFDQKVDRRHADQHGEKRRQREQEEITGLSRRRSSTPVPGRMEFESGMGSYEQWKMSLFATARDRPGLAPSTPPLSVSPCASGKGRATAESPA